ncbi:MAG: cytochrome c peroxidase [Myxococcota bacterium]
MSRKTLSASSVAVFVLVAGCNEDNPTEVALLSDELSATLESLGGEATFILPDEDNLAEIPADPANPLTATKVELGKFLYHETGLATAPNDESRVGTYSCASCHHSAAGFKAGVPQGIADGGQGFGTVGEGRELRPGLDGNAPATSPMRPDIQPVASPTTLNVAYQEVMLWNGQFGNASSSSINFDLPMNVVATPGTPKAENVRGLAGVEIQAIAGLGVHRLEVEGNTLLQTLPEYRELFAQAFPNSTDTLEDAAKAIAAFERTLLTNRSPFQRWLRGDRGSMTISELRGANLFFGKAGCNACHTGPALSSRPGARADEVFMAIGFDDLDTDDSRVHGTIGDADSRGRGGFTGNPEDDFKFKIPSLYNLADAPFYGHGASFNNIRAVVEYKNMGRTQRSIPADRLDARFRPLGLSAAEVGDLTVFLETALHDGELDRYVPESLPSGNCFPNADPMSMDDLGCP